jgi:hypothetical protein
MDMPSSPLPAQLSLNAEQWADWRWRISNLYWIVDDSGHEIAFRPNGMQLKLIEEFWFLNVVHKARQHGFCLHPSTRVLTADLRWVSIADLSPGQEIVAVDESPPGRGKARRMRTATVRAAVEVHRKAYRLLFDDGRSVVCTGQHPWLSRKSGTEADWRAIESDTKKKLTVGTSVRWVTKPWEAASAEDGWFGGMLDGEGSLANGNRPGASVNVSQRVGAVFDRLRAYCHARGYAYRVESDIAERASKYGKTPVPRVVLSRMNEMFRVIGQCRPTRFICRRWWEGRELPGKRSGNVGWSRIVSIEPLGEQTMVDLQTSVGTYIAEGFVSHNTTLIDLLGLDLCVFNSNQSAAIIAHTLEAARTIFRNKIDFPYKHLPDQIKQAVPLVSDTAMSLVFANGSAVSVGTSLRSGTLQLLHVSEFGKIAAKFPEKAREIVTGAFNTVHPGQFIFVESTAEGRGGRFYDLCKKSAAITDTAAAGRARLTELDFKFHFVPWFVNPKYAMNPIGIPIPDHYQRYFDELEVFRGISLSPAQKAWYVKKAAQMTQDGKEDLDMKREYPSYWEEAFQASVEGTYYGNLMAQARKDGRIGRVPHVPSMPVNTFWDLGRNDTTAIWYHQFIASNHRFIGTYENEGEGLAHYVTEMQSHPYLWGRHFLPHDADNQNLERNESRVDRLVELGVPREKIVVVPRVEDVLVGIELTRAMLPLAWFDEELCDGGIRATESYHKEWDEKLSTFKPTPAHDWASNYADALRQWAQGWSPEAKQASKKGRSRNWRTA